MGFKRAALLAPLELLHLDQCADFVCRTSLSGLFVQSPGLSALGSLRRTPWRKCQAPAFSSLHFLAPQLLDASRDAYLVQRETPHLVFSMGMVPSCGQMVVTLRGSIHTANSQVYALHCRKKSGPLFSNPYPLVFLCAAQVFPFTVMMYTVNTALALKH